MQTLSMTLLGPLVFTLYGELHLTYGQLVILLIVCGGMAFAMLPFTGKFADNGNARLSVTLGFTLLSFSLGLIATIPPLPFWAILICGAIIATGYAFLTPGWAALVTKRLPVKERPAAWGALMTVENIGVSLGASVGAYAYATLGTSGPFIVGGFLTWITALGYVLFGGVFNHTLEDNEIPEPKTEESKNQDIGTEVSQSQPLREHSRSL